MIEKNELYIPGVGSRSKLALLPVDGKLLTL
jgi:hypothetical protein